MGGANDEPHMQAGAGGRWERGRAGRRGCCSCGCARRGKSQLSNHVPRLIHGLIHALFGRPPRVTLGSRASFQPERGTVLEVAVALGTTRVHTVRARFALGAIGRRAAAAASASESHGRDRAEESVGNSFEQRTQRAPRWRRAHQVAHKVGGGGGVRGSSRRGTCADGERDDRGHQAARGGGGPVDPDVPSAQAAAGRHADEAQGPAQAQLG